MRFSPVTDKCDNIIIVGSSKEAVNFQPIAGYSVIAVNNAISITRGNTDFWFTLDPSKANLQIMRTKPFSCKYYCAVPNNFQREMTRKRERVPTAIHYLDRVAGDGPFSCKYGLQESKYSISTGNSAYGALNLAYHMNPKKIILLGVSGDNQLKFDGKKCYDLSHLPDLFSSAVSQLEDRGIEVINGNEDTRLKCFIKKPFKQLV